MAKVTFTTLNGKLTYEGEFLTLTRIQLLMQALRDDEDLEQIEKVADESITEPQPELVNVLNHPRWYEKGELVKVKLNCPYCQTLRTVNGRFGDGYTKCPSCLGKVHNSPATDKGYGYKDDEGHIYLAEKPYLTRDEMNEMKKVFGEDDE